MKCEHCPAYTKTSYEYDEYECYAGVSEYELTEDKKAIVDVICIGKQFKRDCKDVTIFITFQLLMGRK